MRNENKEVRYSNKIDIWAAGMTLYEMMCLEYPIEAANDRERLNSIAKCKNFRQIPEIYSKDIKDLVQSLLNKDPNDRPTA